MEWTTFAIFGLIFYGIGTLLNSPVPAGYADPWTLRIFGALVRVFWIKDWFLGFFLAPEDIMVKNRGIMHEPPEEFIMNMPVQTEDTEFDGVIVRIYKPEDRPASNNPGVVFFHGGGWALGDIESYDNFCRQLAHESKAIIASVEYRRAPEHPFPAPHDDCVTATTFFLNNAERYGVDSKRIAIAGDSAGGNLAASVALKLRDMKFEPQPKLQVLIYPCLQAIDFRSPSYQDSGSSFTLPHKMMVAFWNIYAKGHAKHVDQMMTNLHTPINIKQQLYTNQLSHDKLPQKERQDYSPNPIVKGDDEVWEDIKEVFTNPYFAPLMSTDLHNLPQAVVITAELDVLRNDGFWYVDHLRGFEVDVTHKHFDTGFHGFASVGRLAKQKDCASVRSYVFSSIKDNL